MHILCDCSKNAKIADFGDGHVFYTNVNKVKCTSVLISHSIRSSGLLKALLHFTSLAGLFNQTVS